MKTSKSSSLSTAATTLGDGCSAIYGNSLGRSAFGNLANIAEESVKVDTANEFNLKKEIIYISDSHELSKKTSHQSGLTVNFGFFKIGHKNESELTMTESSKNIYFLASARRIGKVIRLGDTTLTKESLDVYNQDPEIFAEDYGTQYISSLSTGYYCYVLIEIKCSSQQQAKQRKKELELAASNENANADAKLGSGSNFTELCNQYGAHSIMVTNLTELPKQKYSSPIESNLAIVDLVEERDPIDAPTLMTIYNSYPSSKIKLVNDQTTKVMNLLKNKYRITETLPKARMQVNDLKPASDYLCDYKNSEDIKHYIELNEEMLSQMDSALFLLDKNIFSDVSSYLKEVEEIKNNIEKIKTPTELLPIKLNLIKHAKDVDSSGEDGPKDALAKILSPGNESWFNPKFSMSDRHKAKSRSLVIFSKDYISTNKYPDPKSDWKNEIITHSSSGSISHDKYELQLRDWMMKNLSPWQYYHCSITCTATQKGVYSYAVVYPPKH
ncbi:hypothetical protein RJ45_18075 [Photobacterium gaetbulicola]|uniref:MACPF domain-containing protein n=1 Tax=Photobacterium gaetbulicola TaxID=1295392 RepID=A0A0B9G0X1_9GAMM|nr:hypothetical protein [Photobacterium gaetbulicola]KHT62289.1 hypothetical protein RJ45_18075 [Photobacterium gaetbulicola]